MNSPQGAGGKKNTDDEIRDGVWGDSTKANGADVGKNTDDEIRDGAWADSTKANGADIPAIKTQTDKAAGEATTNGTETKNWNIVNDSPDSDGGLVTTLGTAATKNKLHSLLLDVSALTNGAAITVKLFQKINDNADVCVYDEDFVVNTDPDGLWIVNGTLVIHDQLKVVVKSDTSESVPVEYTAVLEVM